MQDLAVHCEPTHALPFDAADRIFALRWRRRLSRSLEFLCALGDLKDAPLRHRLDQELEAIWRVACPNPVKVRRKGAH
jgi:hypothetical protein